MNTHIQARTFDFEFGSSYNENTKYEGGTQYAREKVLCLF